MGPPCHSRDCGTFIFDKEHVSAWRQPDLDWSAGLALDCTCTQLAVPHPAPDQEALGPSPVLVLATSDGQFRFFSLGRRCLCI